MPLSEELRSRLETTVANAVWAERNQSERQGTLTPFHQELRDASEELKKLSRGVNVDYDLPRMGEAYALWYHMRRVSQMYEALEKFPQVATPLEKGWADPWRVLDVGAGTGAGAMGLSAWTSQAFPPGFVQRITVDCLEPSRHMISAGENIMAQMHQSGLPIAQTRWLQGGIGAAADYATDGYHLILCSTTFDYLEERDWDGKIGEIMDFFNERLRPGGCVVFLAPNRGFDEGQQGPKVRFVEELISAAGLKSYNWSDVASYKGVQTEVLEMRTRLTRDAIQAGAGFGLGNGVPDYSTDTFSYGCYQPRAR
ncbi:MAG TPA: hypothetical protein VIB55_08060 [Longimicrobium sp.]